MGVIKHFSANSSSQAANNQPVTSLPNPNPNNYTIIRHKVFKNNSLVIEIKYHDSTNYEGKKIMVYENCKYQDLIAQKFIDPHFSDNKKFRSPIARFEPTSRGWTHACNYAEMI